MDPRASLDDVEKRKFLTLPGLELRHFKRHMGFRSKRDYGKRAFRLC
jgi:hypothetical protein